MPYPRNFRYGLARSGAGFLPGFRNSVGTGYRSGLRRSIALRQRNARSATMTRRRRPVRSGQGITTEYDRKLIYKRKSMPRRARRRWSRFNKKVNFVAERSLGTNTIVFNKTIVYSNTTSGNHVVGEIALYGMESTSSHLNDVNRIASDLNITAPTVDDGTTKYDTTRLMFHSAILDVTIRNASTVLAGATQISSSAAKLEVDVYEIMVNAKMDTETSNFPSLIVLYDTFDSIPLPLKTGITAIDVRQRGTTPWDCTNVLSRFRVKILKKTKYFLPNGETMTYQIRDPRRRVIERREATSYGGANRVGWTRWLLVYAKLVPGLTVGTEDGQYTEAVNIGLTRKYTVKIEGQSDDRAAYYAAT